ncbi:hypothetical protein DCC27_004515 [Auritidibacter sp. NML130574]|uniref:serine/threonine protein kinase n=1 Tax=Auritidibacter sp. NML130574 TaxID=2170745 RepID=UPI000D73D913|nr:protein kinase [Auritidibacter sp. NML130574]AXR73685.1 hypothetical protein DCC27_004515 [Auritidibacter sp. NML130574]
MTYPSSHTSDALPQPPQPLSGEVGELYCTGERFNLWRFRPPGFSSRDAPAVLKIPDLAQVGEERHSQIIDRAQRFSHPHVVPLIGAVELRDDSAPQVGCWQLMRGSHAAKLVNTMGPLELEQCLTIVIPVAQALSELHRQGLSHGGLGPAKVVFDLNGAPYLTDAGPGQPVHGFAAPEQHVKASAVTSATDVYSWAALCWYLLTGRVPGKTYVRAPLPSLVPDIDEHVVDVLEACLDDDPTQRPTMRHCLEAVVHWGEPRALELHSIVAADLRILLPTKLSEPPSEKKNRPRRPARRRLPKTRRGLRQRAQRRFIAGAGAMAVGLALISGSPSLTAESQEPARATQDTVSVTDHMDPERLDERLEQIVQQRSAAFRTTDPDMVDRYAVGESEVAVHDREMIEGLVEQGLNLEDFSMRGQRTGEVEILDDTTVRIPVQWGWPQQEVTDEGAHGVVRASVQESHADLVVTLQYDQGWKISRVHEH